MTGNEETNLSHENGQDATENGSPGTCAAADAEPESPEPAAETSAEEPAVPAEEQVPGAVDPPAAEVAKEIARRIEAGVSGVLAGFREKAEAGFREKAEIATVTKTIDDGVSAVLGAFKGKVAVDRDLERKIRDLHGELQKSRSDLEALAVRPLAERLIDFHHDFGRHIDAIRAKQPAGPTLENLPTAEDPLAKLKADFQRSVELILDHSEIFPYRGEPGEAFDRDRQKIVGKVTAPDEAQDGKVEGTTRPGFEQGDRILRKAEVSVYEYSPPAAAEDKPGGHLSGASYS